MQKKRQKNKTIKRIVIFLFWVAVWQLFALCVGNRILLAGPWETAKAWLANVQSTDFFLTCLYSLGRIGLGFVLGFVAGSLFGILAYRFKILRDFLSPLMTFFKSVPVASFVVLLLIWWGSKGLSAAVVFIVVLPAVYISVVQGLSAVDGKMLEMARVFRMPLFNRFFYIYRPALKPFVDSCLGICLGMSWKSGVAAEVIGTPDFSIGERMYMSKIYLDTAGLFAWTGTVIVISFLFEKAGLFLWRRFCNWNPGFGRSVSQETKDTKQQALDWELNGLSKTFEEKPVLEHISKTLESGKIYCLMAPSGAGKTTLLRILAGAESSDGKEVAGGRRLSMSFQEDRLAEHISAVENVMMVLGSERKEEICNHLLKLLPPESLDKPCCALSGGMKRRVSLVRAVMAKGDALLLDEPFAGLDEENKEKAIKYLLKNQRGRTVIVATHDEQDAVHLGGEVWKLCE